MLDLTLKIGLSLLMLSSQGTYISNLSPKTNKTPIHSDSQRAWPGRPGGNGDGSEEWLSGEYGQTNGPYRIIAEERGQLTSYMKETSKNTAFRDFLVSLTLGTLNPLIGSAYGAVSCGVLFSENVLPGNYYIVQIYVSGRSSKTILSLYDNSNYTGYRGQRVFYSSW